MRETSLAQAAKITCAKVGCAVPQTNVNAHELDRCRYEALDSRHTPQTTEGCLSPSAIALAGFNAIPAATHTAQS
jgi:hypothetical protein